MNPGAGGAGSPPRLETCVAVALITRDDRILVQQRGEGSHLEGTWEFPGGKLEPDESWEEGLVREVREELGTTGVAAGIFDEKTFDYPEKRVRLRFYWTVIEGEPSGPHRWVTARELLLLEPVPEANKELIPKIAQVLEGHAEPHDARGERLTVIAWAVGFIPVAVVIAALVFLTIDNFARIEGVDVGKLLEARFGLNLIGGDRAIFLGVFVVAWGLLTGWVYSRTARRSAP